MESRGLAEGQEASSIGPLYMVIFAQVEVNFRFSEFESAAEYLDVRYAFVPVPQVELPLSSDASCATADGSLASARSATDANRAFALVHLADDDAARKLASRVTCIRAIWQHWATAFTLEDVQELLRTDERIRALWKPWSATDTAWRATVFGHGRSISEKEKRQKIETFEDALTFAGPISLHTPQCEWCYAEEWTMPRQLDDGIAAQLGAQSPFILAKDVEPKERPNRQRLLAVHVGRKVAEGTARDMIVRMDVKQRAYIGNTTMESGMSLVQANMALAGPGKMIYDPFAGTGSLLLACSAFGAYVYGSDIDGRMLRGKEHASGKIGILRSAEQYGLEKLFVDALNFDITQHPLRRGALFDAIVADPPYGVRAGAKRQGKRDESKYRTEPYKMTDGTYSHEKENYIPPSKPYALDDLLSDLLAFAAYMLVPRGRLVFWMPTMIDVDEEVRKPSGEARQMAELKLPPSKHFRLVAHSMQDFNQWGRRLITLEKIDGDHVDALHELVLPSAPSAHFASAKDSASDAAATANGKQRVRATDNPNEFRNRYFATSSHKQKKNPDRQDSARPS